MSKEDKQKQEDLRKAEVSLKKLSIKVKNSQNIDLQPSESIYTSYGKRTTSLGMRAFKQNEKFFKLLNEQ